MTISIVIDQKLEHIIMYSVYNAILYNTNIKLRNEVYV